MIGIRKALATVALAGTATVALLAGTGTAQATVAGRAGAHSTPSVICNGAGSHSVVIPAPTMKAYNATSATDYQYVEFQPVLFKWSSTSASWVTYSSGMYAYGTASDYASPSTYYNASTGAYLGNGRMTMTLPGSGYWGVAYRMYWLTGSTTSGSDYLWASGYYSTSAVGAVQPLSYCTT